MSRNAARAALLAKSDRLGNNVGPWMLQGWGHMARHNAYRSMIAEKAAARLA